MAAFRTRKEKPKYWRAPSAKARWFTTAPPRSITSSGLRRVQKKYPFVEIADYRSGSVNVYNKIATEARAKRYEVDVLDLEPGEVYGITKAGLIDPYLSPSRKGIAREFMDKEGYWTTFYHLAVVLGYNTEKVRKDEAPKSYEDLLNPNGKEECPSTRRTCTYSAQ